jgi:hypothetical protein
LSTISRQPIPKSTRGAALLAALCLALVFTIALSSYIALCYTSLAMSTRNLVNNHSQELAEAGIEQALYACNNSDWTGWTTTVGSPTGGQTTAKTTMTMTSSGLVATSSSPTSLNYGNGANGTANITVIYNTGSPTQIQKITSQGVMTLPTGSILSGAQPSISQTITYGGIGTSATATAPLFVNAVAAMSGNVKFSSGGTLDSYNSNPSAGVYQDYSAGIAGYSAIVTSCETTSSSATVRLMSAVVHGYATGYDYSSPASTNWLSYTANAGKLVGPITSSSTYVDTTRIISSPAPYQPVFSEALPTPTIYLGTLNYSTSLGNPAATASSPPMIYDVNSLTLSGNTQIQIVGPVVILAYGSVSISGTGTAGIYLTNKYSSLQIFQEYGSTNLGAYGITNSNTIPTTGVPPLPKRVAILSTNNTLFTVTLSMTPPFYGVIYVPYMPVTVSSSANIHGAIVGLSVSFTDAAPALHYDLALRSPDLSYGDAAFSYLNAPITVGNLMTSVP